MTVRHIVGYVRADAHVIVFFRTRLVVTALFNSGTAAPTSNRVRDMSAPPRAVKGVVAYSVGKCPPNKRA